MSFNVNVLPLLKTKMQVNDITRVFRLLKPFILKQKKSYFVLLALMGINIFLTIAFAWFFGTFTNAAIKANFPEIKSFIPTGLILLFLSLSSRFLGIYFETKAQQGTKRDLKNHLFQHILRLPASVTNNRQSGELISHFTTDIHSVDGFLGPSLISLLRLPIIYVVVFFYLLHLNWILCLISLLIAPLACVASVYFGVKLRRNGHALFRLYAKLNTQLDETFHGLSLIRTFTLEKRQAQEFEKKNSDLLALELENAKLQGFFYTGGSLVSTVTFLLSLCMGAYFVSRGHMTVGALITFVNLVNHLVYPLTSMASQWAGFQKAISAIERVLDVLETPTDGDQLPEYTDVSNVMTPTIEFKNVSFTYTEDQPVFRAFNLKIPAGKVVAFVGPSGAGKTTLFNLLLGFYKPIEGEIQIGGRSLESFTLSELRSAIGYVPQETFLFAGTIKENLMLARPGISEEDMIEATKAASLHDFIQSLPDGYDTEIGERGVKLSGGQKQRVAIARAILKEAPILLLDEATSALDNQTEFEIKQALDQLTGCTTLVIAHRLSTIQNADLIVVMDQGRIIQMGTHRELIREPGLYRKMHDAISESQETLQVVSH